MRRRVEKTRLGERQRPFANRDEDDVRLGLGERGQNVVETIHFRDELHLVPVCEERLHEVAEHPREPHEQDPDVIACPVRLAPILGAPNGDG